MLRCETMPIKSSFFEAPDLMFHSSGASFYAQNSERFEKCCLTNYSYKTIGIFEQIVFLSKLFCLFIKS